MLPVVVSTSSEAVEGDATSMLRRDGCEGVRPVMLVAVVAGLTAVALVARLSVLPRSGFFHDDAWQVVAAVHGSPGQLLEIGGNQPGFTAVLMALAPLLGPASRAYTYPALVVGAVGPAVLLWFLRRLGNRLSTATLLAAALVVAEIPVIYSGRVKTYVLDPLLVIAVIVVVERLARRTWRWQTGAAWAVGSLAIGTVSPFALLATVAGGLVLVAHAERDRRRRAVAVGAHLALAAGFVLFTQRSYHSGRLRNFWRFKEEAFIGLDETPASLVPDPPALVLDTWRHLRQLLVVYPGGPGWLATVLTVVALAGLGVLCFGRHRLVGRTFVVLLGLAVLGSMAARVPFGALQTTGLRVSLWTVPLVAAGLATAFTTVSQPLLRLGSGRRVVDGVCCVGAVLVLILGYPHDVRYGNRGTAPATAFVEDQTGAGDVVLLLFSTHFAFAAETDRPIRLSNDPQLLHGIGLDIPAPGIVLVPHGVPTSQQVAVVEDATGGASRVFVMSAITAPDGPDPSTAVASELDRIGFDGPATRQFGGTSVEIWQR